LLRHDEIGWELAFGMQNIQIHATNISSQQQNNQKRWYSAARRQKINDQVVEVAAGQRQLKSAAREQCAPYFLVSSIYRMVSFFKYLSQEMLSHKCTPKLSIHFSP
jgi:hypothetical protein